MGQESDDIVSLPAPPPPNPAARRSAIDMAMRKFDGIEDAPSKPASARPGLLGWASSHRRATGGLVTAALIAVVGIPAMQIALRNQPTEEVAERAAPGLATADVEPIEDNAAAAAAAAAPTAEPQAPIPIARNEPVEPPAEPALAKEERSLGFAASSPEQKARAATVAPMFSSPAPAAAAPPPPPPPPPAPAPAEPMAEREAAADAVAVPSGNLTVTGQLARRQNMKSAAPAAPATAATNENASTDFQDKLQSAFRTNNRNAILGLVAFPLRVDFNGDTRTYRTRSDVERDFDRIFTAEVRGSVLIGQATRHLSLAPICSRQPCAPGSSLRIRAVRP